MFLKNKNIIFKIRKSKVTDYAALITSLAASICSALAVIDSTQLNTGSYDNSTQLNTDSYNNISLVFL